MQSIHSQLALARMERVFLAPLLCQRAKQGTHASPARDARRGRRGLAWAGLHGLGGRRRLWTQESREEGSGERATVGRYRFGRQVDGWVLSSILGWSWESPWKTFYKAVLYSSFHFTLHFIMTYTSSPHHSVSYRQATHKLRWTTDCSLMTMSSIDVDEWGIVASVLRSRRILRMQWAIWRLECVLEGGELEPG